MGRLAAALFARLQAARFYREAHAEAVATLPVGHGRRWSDVGCGPGLLARLAAARGYQVTGYDFDHAMLTVARCHPAASTVSGGFKACDLATLAALKPAADVVSAASLLAVLPDSQQALRDLLACVAPGGRLLLIETTHRMRLGLALRWLWHNGWGEGGLWLLLWAMVRHGRTIVDEAWVGQLNLTCNYRETLGGMLGIWCVERGSAIS